MVDDTETVKSAKFLMGSAYGFHLLAQKIAKPDWLDHTGQVFEAWPLFFANLGYAFELSLKAYIVYHGGTKCEVKHEIGHDLKRALKKAHSLGLTPSNAVAAAIGKIAAGHKDRSFFYLENADIQNLPDFAEAMAASTELIQMIASQLPLDDLVQAC